MLLYRNVLKFGSVLKLKLFLAQIDILTHSIVFWIPCSCFLQLLLTLFLVFYRLWTKNTILTRAISWTLNWNYFWTLSQICPAHSATKFTNSKHGVWLWNEKHSKIIAEKDTIWERVLESFCYRKLIVSKKMTTLSWNRVLK